MLQFGSYCKFVCNKHQSYVESGIAVTPSELVTSTTLLAAPYATTVTASWYQALEYCVTCSTGYHKQCHFGGVARRVAGVRCSRGLVP